MTLSWKQYLFAGVLLAGGFVLLPPGVGRDVAYVAVGASGIVALLVGVWRHRPAAARAWYLLAAGGTVWVLADIQYSWYEHVAMTAPFPSFADVLYLSAYPVLAAGLLTFVWSRGHERWSTALLDSTIITIGLGLVSFVFLIEPTWAAGGPVLDRIVGVAYPLGDGLLLAMLIRLATAPGVASGASRLLASSFGVFLITDSLFLAATFVPAIEERLPLLDPGWAVAYVLWGAAALHPSMRALTIPAPAGRDGNQMGRLALIAASVMIGPAIIATELVGGNPLSAWEVLAGSAAMMILFLLRMIRMVHQLEVQADRLGELADTDFVTGLANRRGFVEHLGTLLRGPELQEAVLLLIDLDRYAEITDTLGHTTGDALLHAVGSQLRTLNGRLAFVARMDGDSFGVLVPSIASDRDAEATAVRIREALERPYQLADISVSVEVSIGVVVVPEDADEPALALHRADVALSAARVRPGQVARYGAEMETGGTVAPLLMGELRAAIERHEIILHYQPQVQTSDGRVLGVEALARWQHPLHGLLGPDAFIAACEQTGLIAPLTRRVLDCALHQCAQWRSDGLDLVVAVNLSVRNLLDPGLVDDVRSALERHGLTPASLELEITESSAMVDPRRSMQVLSTLADMGVTLSIDDYGTGHSSLAYLQRLPVSRLKIDQSFVAGLLTDDASAAIVRSTIELARHLQLDVIAEGVEDDVTLLMLRDMQCAAVQGYGLGRPMRASAIPALIESIERRLPGILDRREALDAVRQRSRA